MNTTILAGKSFSWILQTSGQAAVLVLLVLIVQMIFRHKLSPAWRYGLWLLVVVRLLLPSAPQTAWSIFNVAKLPPPLDRVESASLPRTAPANPVPPILSAWEQAKPVLESPVEASAMPASLRTVQTELVPGTARGNLARTAILDWHRVALLVWLLGLCFFGTRLLWSNLRFWLRIAAEPAVTNEPARRQLDDCLMELGIRQAVKLIETEAVECPAVHGLWQKRLLLPKGIFDRFSREQVRCIFLHELAHIKRRDLEVNWLVSVLQALHWFNPLVWLGFGRMRADREMACDCLALAHLGKAPSESYGETIIKVVENLVRSPSAPGLLALSEDKRQLEERIRMIASFRKRPGLSVLALWLIAGIAVVGLTDASRARSSTAKPGEPPAQPAKDLQRVVFASRNTNGPMAKLLEEEMTIHLENVLLKDVFHYLNTNADRLSVLGHPPRVSIVFDWWLPALTKTLMDVNLDKVRLGDLFRDFGRKYDLQFHVADEAVWVVDAREPKEPPEAARFAAMTGDLEKVKVLLKDNPALVSSKDARGWTPLHWAAEMGHKDVAELLLANAAEVNAKGFGGDTPLHWAARNGYLDMAVLLVANKADVNAKDNDGDTPLHWAAEEGLKDVVELLLANKADVNAKQRYSGWERSSPGWTPLHLAAMKGHKDVTALLLAKGVEVDAKDNWGDSPLFCAESNGHEDVAELLRQHGGHALGGHRWLASITTSMAQQVQALANRPGIAPGQYAMTLKQYPAANPQALADLEGKVKDRQVKKATVNETTINLKPYVNCELTDPLADKPDQKEHTLETLPTGVHTYGGVPFDVQGIIQLNGPSVQTGVKLWPAKVKDIAMGRPVKKLHLLHGAFNIVAPNAHITFAKLILHYADGSQEELAMDGGTHTLRCVDASIPQELDLLPSPQTELAWLGTNPYLKQNNPSACLHLYRTTFDNPKPDKQVATIGYVSTMVNPGPFMVGLTIE